MTRFTLVEPSFSAASTLCLSGTIAPRRYPPSAVMMQVAPRVVRAILDALRAEAAEDDGVNRAEPGAGQHGDGRLGDHRHVDEHAIALPDVIALQDVGEAADLAVQLRVGDRARLARLAFPDDRRLVLGRSAQMPVEAVLRDVELAADEPFRERRLPLERLLGLLPPVEILGQVAPEFLGLLDRFFPHRSVLLHAADARPFDEALGRFEDAVLDEVRLDVHRRGRVGGRGWRGVLFLLLGGHGGRGWKWQTKGSAAGRPARNAGSADNNNPDR